MISEVRISGLLILVGKGFKRSIDAAVTAEKTINRTKHMLALILFPHRGKTGLSGRQPLDAYYCFHG